MKCRIQELRAARFNAAQTRSYLIPLLPTLASLQLGRFVTTSPKIWACESTLRRNAN